MDSHSTAQISNPGCDLIFSAIAMAKLPLSKSWITVHCKCILEETVQFVSEKILNTMYV